MNGKKLIALLLALCLALTAFPALAAPTRDIRAIEVTADEKLLTLVDIACEAIPEECFGAEARIVLEKDQVPDAYLMEQALWAAVLMTRESLRLTAEEAGQLYRQIFTCGEFDPAVLAGSDLPFIMADEDFRIETMMARQNLSEDQAKKLIRQVDKDRASYYRYYTDQIWGERENFDLIINSAKVGVDGAVKLIKDYIEAMQ